MKKYIFITVTILLVLFIISSFICISSAVGLDVLGDPNPYIQNSDDNSAVIEIGNVIVWAVRTIGEAIAVVMLLIIGIKYVLASAEEKAEYKQSMWPYLLGAILIFAGAEVTNIIYKSFTVT